MGARADLHILVMAGGSGTRFWPKSRASKPKQLLALWDDKTLIEHTVDRFAPIVPLDRIWIVTTEKLVAPTREVLGKSRAAVKVLAEPEGKNTAPCIAWGVSEIAKVDPNATIAVMAADHYIADEPAFLTAVEAAIIEAQKHDALVTLGIRPTRPETGYGYIEVAPTTSGGAAEVLKFVEKPDQRTAVKYVESGRFFWNAGMFIFTAKTGMRAFERCMPELASLFEQAWDVKQKYSKIRKEDAVSFDYGVMEVASSKGIRVSVVPAACGWNDVGSFPALEDIECAVRGEVVVHEAGSNVVQTDKGLVALLGVSDLVVVRDGDVVLVAAKERAQDVKKLLEKVKAVRPELL